jgi:hypothetical protein
MALSNCSYALKTATNFVWSLAKLFRNQPLRAGGFNAVISERQCRKFAKSASFALDFRKRLRIFGLSVTVILLIFRPAAQR